MKKRLCFFAMITISVSLTTAMLIGCGSFGKKATTVDVFWDTSLLQNVTRVTDDGLQKFFPRVSPDGKMMLYGELSNKSQYNIILLRNVSIPAKTPLVSGDAYVPSWYDNNNNFAFVLRERGDNRIVRSAITGAGRTYVTRNPVGRLDSNPTIRGDVILFDTDTSGKRQIVSMKDNGTEITFLGDGISPSWHPTLPKFLFIRDGDVYEMDMSSIQVTQLFSDPNYNCAYPSYSANGQYILFQKGTEQKITGKITERVGGLLSRTRSATATVDKWQIFVMKADGTNLSTVTVGNVDSYHPCWDVNGYIYFVSNASGKYEIYRARINLN
jgi:TolB protein